MVTEKIKHLAELKAKVAKLEASLEAQRPVAMAALPSEFGFDSLAAFIKALKVAAGHKRKVKKTKAAKPRKNKRAKITDEIKAAIKAATEAGKTGAVIAKELGISSASVQNVKKELGLTKPRATGAPAT